MRRFGSDRGEKHLLSPFFSIGLLSLAALRLRGLFPPSCFRGKAGEAKPPSRQAAKGQIGWDGDVGVVRERRGICRPVRGWFRTGTGTHYWRLSGSFQIPAAGFLMFRTRGQSVDTRSREGEDSSNWRDLIAGARGMILGGVGPDMPPFQGFGLNVGTEPQGFALGCLGLPRWGDGLGLVRECAFIGFRAPVGITPRRSSPSRGRPC